MPATLSPILNEHGRPFERARSSRDQLLDMWGRADAERRPVHARFDAAQDSDDYKNYWSAADALDADSAHSRAVRQKIVSRARYEVGNNGYADGMVQTYSNYLVGTGPTLRMQTRSTAFNEMVEAAWKNWAEAIMLRRKLWAMAHAKCQDGEGFGVARNNPRNDDPVKLDLGLFETEQCQTPWLPYNVPGYIDGIRFDDFGNPLWYDVLPQHPGGQWAVYNQQPERVPARFIMHWYQLRRPGQHRGVPEFRSTLNVGASARRWREATVAAAETAADFCVMLESQIAPDLDNPHDKVDALSTLEIAKRMMTALPYGYAGRQMKAEHPNATFESFNKAQISEQGRPKSMPYNVAAADSSNSNFASGKLDHITWFRALDVDRADGNDLVLHKLFVLWFAEAREIYGWNWSQDRLPPHAWDWPPLPVADERARAIANNSKLSNGSASLSDVYAENGKDFDEAVNRLARDYGVEVEQFRRVLLFKNFGKDAVAAMAGSAAPSPPIPPQSGPPQPGASTDE